MKMFKKLAAVALAAVLALSMVGCGKANSVNPTKQLVLDLIQDTADVAGPEYKVNNTAEMDAIAQKVLNSANEITTMPTEAQLAAMGFDANKVYGINFAENYTYKTSLITDYEKQMMLTRELSQNAVGVKNNKIDNAALSELSQAKEHDVGVAVGKVGDKEYIVVVQAITVTATPKG